MVACRGLSPQLASILTFTVDHGGVDFDFHAMIYRVSLTVHLILPDAQAGRVLASRKKTDLQNFLYGSKGKKPHQNVNKEDLLKSLEAKTAITLNGERVAQGNLQRFPGRPVANVAES